MPSIMKETYALPAAPAEQVGEWKETVSDPETATAVSRSARRLAWTEDNKVIDVGRDTVSVEQATE